MGIDTLAVAIGLGLSGVPRMRWFRVGLTFACFEGLMPVAGLLVGQAFGGVIGTAATYIAAIILIVVGGREVYEAFTDDDRADAIPKRVPSQAKAEKPLLLLGLSVSLDELAVGVALGVLQVPLGLALAYVALQAFILTFLGLMVGQRLGVRLKERAELIAGIALTLLGLALALGELTGTHFV